jgi:hypothetical protein
MGTMRHIPWLLVGFLSLIGCENESIVYGPCTRELERDGECTVDPPDAGAGDAGDGGTGGAGGDMQSSLCSGACVPPAPLGWSGPALLWMGPPDQVPDCPADATNIGYEGFADLAPQPRFCAACLCDTPEASCDLPLGWAAHATPSCPGDGSGTTVTAFAAPDGWSGECTAANAIPAGQLCDGQPCVQSLSIEAPVVVTGACAARADEPLPVPDVHAWATQAKACIPGAYKECDEGQSCMAVPPGPALAPPDGFSTCIFHEDEESCSDEYPVKHVFYDALVDSRDCTPCSCGEPEGASCDIMASVFSDGACAVPLASSLVSSDVPFCAVTPPGVALGSKSATVVAVDPGACAPGGGEPIGDVQPSSPSTFCCRA